jgi:hypothetical protein
MSYKGNHTQTKDNEMNARLSLRRVVTIGCLDGIALVRFEPNWYLLARRLRSPHNWLASTGLDGAAANLAAAALWCVGAWLAVGLLATVFALLPGQLGALGSCFAERLLPTAIRRALAGAAGLSVLLAPVAAGATAAHVAATLPALGYPRSTPTPAWPIDNVSPTPSTATPGSTATPSTVRPNVPATYPVTTTPQSPAQPQTGPRTGSTGTTTEPDTRAVVVRPGDSLWLIAAHRLAPDADAGRVAAEWPRWYAANRSAIGPDPSVLLPGQVLHPPAASSS